MQKYIIQRYDFNTSETELENNFNEMFAKGYEVIKIMERKGLTVVYIHTEGEILKKRERELITKMAKTPIKTG